MREVIAVVVVLAVIGYLMVSYIRSPRSDDF